MNLADRSLLSQVASGIDNVHLVLRNSVGAVVLDTVVSFPLGQDELSLTVNIQVRGESEQFAARFELRAGTTTMFEGTQDIVAKAGMNTPAPTTIPLTFVGPGARAARVTVAPGSATLLPGATVQLNATVADSSGAPIPGAVVGWSSSNEASATVNATGIVTALNVRGTAAVTARTPNGVSASATVRVTLPASRVVVAGGDAQTAAVGASPPQPFVVQVQAVDGVGVGGATVAFGTSVAGASVSAATATTDSTGRASTIMTLGRTVGTHTFTATVSGLGSVSVNETASRGEATVIRIVSGDAQVDTAGHALKQPLVVRVTDANDNVASGVNVTWSRVSGSGTLSATSSSTDAQGQTQTTYTLGNTPGTDVMRAAIAALPTNNVEFTATTKPRAASRVVVVSGSDQTGMVGSAATEPLVVRVLDDAGQAVSGVTLVWNSTNGATLSANTTTTDSTGASRNAFTYPTRPGAFVISAQGVTLVGPSVGFSMTATIGPPAKINFITGGGQSGPGGANVGVAPSVAVSDRFDNPIAGIGVTFTASSGGSVIGSPSTTNASGVATVGSWKLGATAGTQTLTATVGGVSASITATATAAAPPVLAVVQQPSASVANTQLFAVQPKVQLKTAAGVVVKTAGVVVTVALKSAGPTLRGTLTATTDTTGVATFAGVSVKGSTGTNVLTFSASGYTGDTSATFTLVSGPAISVAASSATSLSGVVNTVASPNPTVFVMDSSGNGVGGANVTFAVADTADGAVLAGVVVTDTTGHASPTSWTIGKSVRTDTLMATATGLAGSPVLFIATTSAGAVTQLVKISGDAQTGVTGNPLALAMVVEARDALNNAVSGVTIGFTAFAGGGSPATQSVVTAANGQSSFTLTLGSPGADSVKACLPSCATAQVIFTALAIPVGADAIWTGVTSADWATATNWSPAVVPSGSNNVFVPRGTPNAPALSAAASVGDLTLASGATMSVGTSTLTASGNVLATGATIGGSGTVSMTGAGKQVTGSLPSLAVQVSGVVPAGSLVLGGFALACGQSFAVGSAVITVGGSVSLGCSNVIALSGTGSMTVNGSFSWNGGGYVTMTNPAAKLTVTGDFSANQVDLGDVNLTAGVLELKGNFSTGGNNYQSFRATGAHITRFSGTGSQSIAFSYPATDKSQFANLEVTGGGTLSVNTGVIVAGAMTVTGGSTVSGGNTMYVASVLSSSAGTSLAGLNHVDIYGAGAVFPQIAGTGPPLVQFTSGGTVTAPSNLTLPTSLNVLYGSVLDVGNTSLTVNGSLSWNNGGFVRMTNPAGTLLVTGDVYANQVDLGDLNLTAGILEVKGNFSTGGNNYQSFRATGAHVTRFSGAGAQSLAFSYPATDKSQFANLEVTGGGTLSVNGGVIVAGTMTVSGNSQITGNSTMYVANVLSSSPGTSLAGLNHVDIYGAGAVFPQLAAGTGPPLVQFTSGGIVTAPSNLTLPTSLNVLNGSVLDVGSMALTVNGSLTWNNGGFVRMTNPAGKLLITGDVYTNQVDLGDANLTAGVLEVKGNFSTGGNNYQSFRATGAHITRFSGTSAQSIAFSYPATDKSQFANLEVTGGGTLSVNSGVIVAGTLTVTGNSQLTGNNTMYVRDVVSATAGTSLAGLNHVDIYGAGAVFPQIAGTGPPLVQFTSGGTVTAPSNVTLPTSLNVINGSVLDVGSTALTISGNLSWNAGGFVRMTSGAGSLLVTGDVYTNQVDLGDANLTAGVLEVKGNFSTGGNNYQSFRATGTHITRFSGTGTQGIAFSYPATDKSQFANLEVTGGGTLSVNTGVIVAGTMTVTGGSTVSGGNTMYIASVLSSSAATSLAGLNHVDIYGAGAVFPQIAGTGPPLVQFTSGGTVTAPSNLTLPTSLNVLNGSVLDVGSTTLTINGSLSWNAGGYVRMNSGTGALVVTGDVYTNQVDLGDGALTAGVLEVKGNFSTGGNNYQSYRATGAHITRFSGTGAQSIAFSYPASDKSQFANLEVTNASASGVASGNSFWVAGTFTNFGRFTVNGGHTVTVQGGVTLGASSNTTNLGAFNFPTCALSGSPTTSGFTCPYP